MRCRRDYRDLAPAESQRFIAALYDAKARGVVDSFADEHNVHFTHGHRNSSFLPWHREFLRRFEAELQTYDARVMLPYWNSSDDQSTSSGLWGAAFLGQFDSAWSLGRNLGGGGFLASPNTVDGVLGETSYDAFWPRLEGEIHDGPHPWVGGEMATASSPRDPVFFLHHTFIDMLWAQWQLRNPAAPFVPSPGAPDVGDHMHPWSTTVGDVLDHRSINVYSYPAGHLQDASRVTPGPATPPAVTFPEVPEGLTFFAPAIFGIDACETLTFDVGNPVLDTGSGTFARLDPSVVADPHVEPVARVWFTFTGTVLGASTAHADVTCVETGETWSVPLTGEIIDRPTAAVALVLDRSNSMNEDSGIAPGIKRADVLRFSAPPCVTVLDDEHAAMVLGFDHDPIVMRGLTPANAAGRVLLTAAISSYAPNPNGWTAIGEAVQFAQSQLTGVSGYDIRAMVVLTDGKENHGPHDRLLLSEVSVGDRVFAIGLGTPANLEPGTLAALCNGNQGYLLITGDLNQDAFFRLAKYYQQIISGVTNQDIVLDPDGVVHRGQVVRIPFDIAETDITARAVLLTDNPLAVLFGLETPAGDVIGPSIANPQVLFRTGTAVEMYRVSLPLPLGANTAHVGTWHALLAISGKHRAIATHGFAGGGAQSARYSVSVHAYSNLRMRASLTQTSNEPGATVFVRAALTEYAQPMDSPASVIAEIRRPDDTTTTLTLARDGDAYEGSFVATQAGVFVVRISAAGWSRRGRPFTRETTRTAAVWQGGDRPPADPRSPGDRWCEIVRCLLGQKSIVELLRRHGIDPAELARCLLEHCRHDDRREQIAARLQGIVTDRGALDAVVNLLDDLSQERHPKDGGRSEAR
jgi:hypothetical protein